MDEDAVPLLENAEDAGQQVAIAVGGNLARIVLRLERAIAFLGLRHVVAEQLVGEGILVVVIGVEGDAAYVGGAAQLGDGDLLEGHGREQFDERAFDGALCFRDAFIHIDLTLRHNCISN